MDAFDADALIYASVPGHALGRRVLALFQAAPPRKATVPAGIGSTLLICELLTKPTREDADEQTGQHEQGAGQQHAASRLVGRAR